VAGVILVGQTSGDGLYQQVRAVLRMAAGRGAQAHQGREAARLVDRVLQVTVVVSFIFDFCFDEEFSVTAVLVFAVMGFF
jgi:hypothetical protein